MGNPHCELYQITKIIAEKEVQVVERSACAVPPNAIPAKKVIQVITEVEATADTVFTNKVVKEGVFQVQIIYVGADDFVRHTALAVPFMAETEILPAQPGMQAQNQLLRVESEAQIVTNHHRDGCCCQTFDVKVAASFLIRLTRQVEQILSKCEPRRRCSSYSTRQTQAGYYR